LDIEKALTENGRRNLQDAADMLMVTGGLAKTGGFTRMVLIGQKEKSIEQLEIVLFYTL